MNCPVFRRLLCARGNAGGPHDSQKIGRIPRADAEMGDRSRHDSRLTDGTDFQLNGRPDARRRRTRRCVGPTWPDTPFSRHVDPIVGVAAVVLQKVQTAARWFLRDHQDVDVAVAVHVAAIGEANRVETGRQNVRRDLEVSIARAVQTLNSVSAFAASTSWLPSLS